MSMEEEVTTLLQVGLIIVIGALLVLVIGLIFKYRKAGYGWILTHLLLFFWCAWSWIQLLVTRAYTSSIENSLTIAWLGILWAVSMVSLAIGLLMLRPSRRRNL
ncbi:hypothetical protein [Paenibacillus lutrae]|uniref:Uncharacterized protein n=1 Tax=Paenibacillus lutrae TaxID=2078573 RepID=A0A7X3FES4_9BACL|nr:hypothetical protein [Paenibacillus lutrae]MVO98376.1 hypothetical protein [Paenibacillus lutrae]